MTRREEQIQWLEALIGDFEAIRQESSEGESVEDYFIEDPEAVYEMLQECKQLACDLRLELSMLAALHDGLASVAFDEHQPLPEFDLGGEA